MINAKQISSLKKVRLSDRVDYQEISSLSAFTGSRVNYQIALAADWALLSVKVDSPLADYIQVYAVENAAMDYPVTEERLSHSDSYYITKEPCLMPDILLPIEEKGNALKLVGGHSRALWIRADLPEDLKAGEYKINIIMKSIVADGLGNAIAAAEKGDFEVTKTMTLMVYEGKIPKQEMLYTQIIHADCIADAHGVEIHSEEHWALIEKYIKAAVELGANMMLLPVITPPLDTLPGTARPNIQLAEIKKQDGKYFFNFDKVKRWLDICKNAGITHTEVCPLFSQWGAESAPNIWISENGKGSYLFNNSIASDSEEYGDFLRSFIPALCEFLTEQGLRDKTFFHISDEPRPHHIHIYKKLHDLVTPLISGFKTCEALSDFNFYKNGLVECPTVVTDHIEPFIEGKVENLWAYYCCDEIDKVSNRLLAMPSARNRVIGVQLYKYGIKGFLHWGFNFYNSELSAYKINPYKTTSGDLSFPSGDAFTVYPGKDGPIHSLRGLIFCEGLEDMRLCTMLEAKIGKDAVVKLIEEEAGMEITFKEYPRNDEFLPRLRERLIKEIVK